MNGIQVDSHSHIFNAEDLPIDGFIKKLSPAPRLLTGLFTIPLDRLASWAAPGSREADRLLDLLSGRESAEFADDHYDELISEEELERRLLEGLITGSAAQESARSVDEVLADRLEQLTPEEAIELEAWVNEVGEADLAMEGGAEVQLERMGDPRGWALTRARALRHAARRYLAALRLMTRYRYRIAAELATTYPGVSLFTPALVDFAHTTNDRPSASIQEQITIHSLVSKLSVVGRIPGAPATRFHPFVGYCPYREVATSELRTWDVAAGVPNRYVPFASVAGAEPSDYYHRQITFEPDRARPLSEPSGSWSAARLEIGDVERSIDLVRHAIELGGFAGVKIYPPAGYLPSGNVVRFGESKGQRLDAALDALYAYCVALDVPILTHAAHSNGFEDGYEDFASPAGWELVLAKHPTLRICFGHFGHLHGEPTEGSGGADQSYGWPSRFVDLIDRYENVYADVGNSRFVYNEAYRRRFVEVLQAFVGAAEVADETQLKRRKRLMFGTDYWMNTLNSGHDGYLEVFDRTIGEGFPSDFHQWFMGVNALRFLGFVTGEGDPPTQNRDRIRAFYGSNSLPDWLG